MSLHINPRKPSVKPVPQSPTSDMDVLHGLRQYWQTHGRWPTLEELVHANPGWHQKITYNRLFTLRGSNHDPAAQPPVVRDHDSDTYRLQGDVPEPPQPEVTETLRRPTDAELLEAEAEARAQGGSIYKTLQKRFGHPQSTLGGWLKQARDRQAKPTVCERCKGTGHVGGDESGAACRCAKGDIIAQLLTEECLIAGRQARITPPTEEAASMEHRQFDAPDHGETHVEPAMDAPSHSQPAKLLLLGEQGCHVWATRADESPPEQHDEWPQVVRSNGRARVRVWVCYAATSDVRVMIPREGVTLMPPQEV